MLGRGTLRAGTRTEESLWRKGWGQGSLLVYRWRSVWPPGPVSGSLDWWWGRGDFALGSTVLLLHLSGPAAASRPSWSWKKCSVVWPLRGSSDAAWRRSRESCRFCRCRGGRSGSGRESGGAAAARPGRQDCLQSRWWAAEKRSRRTKTSWRASPAGVRHCPCSPSCVCGCLISPLWASRCCERRFWFSRPGRLFLTQKCQKGRLPLGKGGSCRWWIRERQPVQVRLAFASSSKVSWHAWQGLHLLSSSLHHWSVFLDVFPK